MAPHSLLLVFLVCSSPFLTLLSEAITSEPALAEGLSWKFYKHSCPKVESIVRKHLKSIFKKDITQAAGLLRVHFHDCFVQGCDGSVLLDGSASGPSEQEAPPNLTLRPEAFEIINDLRDKVEEACGLAVSCADILALAARDSIYLTGGPEYEVPLGRRDSLTFATREVTLANLPAPTSNATFLLEEFKKKKLDATDLVALSGGHTIGIGHCDSFSNRLFPTQDPKMDDDFAEKLYETCPASDTVNTTVLDIRTPIIFDNKYYVNLVNRQGLFTSDQDLYSHRKTKKIVKEFAEDQLVFFEKFAISMVKMGMMDVKTGLQGEVRANCSARNSDSDIYISTVADGEEEEL